MPNSVASQPRGLTTSEVAQRLRVSSDKVRTWIKLGRLSAVNTEDSPLRKPRFVVMPEALEAFEKARTVTAPPPKPARRRKQQVTTDFYPD